MAKPATQYICQQCGAAFSKWSGKCSACESWNSLVEEKIDIVPKGMKSGRGAQLELVSLDGVQESSARRVSGVNEFDRVCGGGLVPGSAVLVGGDPGIGKSTMLLQIVSQLSKRDVTCVYISGEESIDQVRLRARRLGVEKTPVKLAAATNVRDILTTIDSGLLADVLVIDSIQTMYVDNIDSAPGTVSQVRTCAFELIRAAKKRGLSVILIGHVTKEGMIAGPRVLEHMVDTVLYFEGDRGHQFRILRAVKNRFGPTDEIGVFEMTNEGLAEVANPSSLFLADHSGNVSGSAVFAGIEGTRPVLVEIQALVAPSFLGNPRRAVIGWDNGRLAMVLAVLEARCGISFSGKDVYLNVAGGLRIHETAADLAVAATLLSAISGVPLPTDTIVFGEIGLSGEIRAVGQTEARLKEASKLGFKRAFMPSKSKGKKIANDLIKVDDIDYIHSMLRHFDTSQNQKVG